MDALRFEEGTQACRQGSREGTAANHRNPLHAVVASCEINPSQVLENLDKHTSADVQSPGQAYEEKQVGAGRCSSFRAGVGASS